VRHKSARSATGWRASCAVTKEEAARLVDTIATGTGGAQLVAGRLQDAEGRIKTVETRLKELAAEAERLAVAQVTPGQVRASLARFSELWQTLPQTQKTRLVRLVVQEVVLDHRDRLRTKK
jgi:predicted nuclease with TOPRIM domain